VKPPRPRRIVDVTGAGDALAGAAVAAILRGLPLGAALREGMAAAMLAVESRASVPLLARADFMQALALVPQAEALHHGAKTGETHGA
ncbi:MAG: carbohydrate kinase, partial [Pseudaminobacter sp.]|nr:carbohydrate kinase [Pseudaminobacter sp.]